VNLIGSLHGKRGGAVVFWSGICSHCVRYDGYLNDFLAKHPDLAFWGIASRHGENVDTVLKAVAERGLSFPILLDPGGKVLCCIEARSIITAIRMIPNGSTTWSRPSLNS
jgi:hypothetical protein